MQTAAAAADSHEAKEGHNIQCETDQDLFRHISLLLRQPPSIMQKAEAPAQGMSGANISKRRKFVADGVFYAELNEFFQRELAEEGYSGVEVRVTPTVTDIIIRATHTQEVLGEQGRRIREVGFDTSTVLCA